MTTVGVAASRGDWGTGATALLHVGGKGRGGLWPPPVRRELRRGCSQSRRARTARSLGQGREAARGGRRHRPRWRRLFGETHQGGEAKSPTKHSGEFGNTIPVVPGGSRLNSPTSDGWEWVDTAIHDPETMGWGHFYRSGRDVNNADLSPDRGSVVFAGVRVDYSKVRMTWTGFSSASLLDSPAGAVSTVSWGHRRLRQRSRT